MDELIWLGAHGPTMGLQVLAAAVCGATIGYERARNDGPAGMKTCLLICTGATLYAHIGIVIFERDHLGDPSRVAAQIVTGIGFLGAGAILRGTAGVTGLTTAATIWLLGAIGIIIGCGYPLSGGLLSLTLMILMGLTRAIEGWLLPDRVIQRGTVEPNDP